MKSARMKFTREIGTRNAANSTHLSGQEKSGVCRELDPLLANALLLQLGHEVPVHDALARVVDLQLGHHRLL